ncbi:MAG: orotidine-5'-phosphate decarboxylase [Phycisphaerae bacterium]
MKDHFGDRLVKAVSDKGVAACVGLDPLLSRLPAGVLSAHGIREGEPVDPSQAAAALTAFGRDVISCIAAHVPVIKINVAFFERYRAPGLAAYFDLVGAARDAGLIVIGDVKRADIGHTSHQYALAVFSDSEVSGPVPDSVTINPYFGVDGVEPFFEVGASEGRGVFVLVQTSNTSAMEVQGLPTDDGGRVVEHVARQVNSWASRSGFIGTSGYSMIGAVVSPHGKEETALIRELMPHSIFLVPGFGAQGRTADDVKCCFRSDGQGALITSSRGVIYAFSSEEYADAGDWREAVSASCANLVASIRSIQS